MGSWHLEVVEDGQAEVGLLGWPLLVGLGRLGSGLYGHWFDLHLQLQNVTVAVELQFGEIEWKRLLIEVPHIHCTIVEVQSHLVGLEHLDTVAHNSC